MSLCDNNATVRPTAVTVEFMLKSETARSRNCCNHNLQ